MEACAVVMHRSHRAAQSSASALDRRAIRAHPGCRASPPLRPATPAGGPWPPARVHRPHGWNPRPARAPPSAGDGNVGLPLPQALLAPTEGGILVALLPQAPILCAGGGELPLQMRVVARRRLQRRPQPADAPDQLSVPGELRGPAWTDHLWCPGEGHRGTNRTCRRPAGTDTGAGRAVASGQYGCRDRPMARCLADPGMLDGSFPEEHQAWWRLTGVD